MSSLISTINNQIPTTLDTSANSTQVINNNTINNLLQKVLVNSSNNSNIENNHNRVPISNKSNENMPPPNSESPTSSNINKDMAPRKRRRKRQDPQSCIANSEVSFIFQFSVKIVVK